MKRFLAGVAVGVGMSAVAFMAAVVVQGLEATDWRRLP